MREKYHLLCSWKSLMLMVALTVMSLSFTACGDDEPDGATIDYYLEIEEEFLVNGLEDHTDRYYSPITLMKEAIREVYPTPTVNGDDTAVIRACDELYLRYLEMYTNRTEEHLTCLIHLVRANKQGSIVKQTERLRTYSFDINPFDQDS